MDIVISERNKILLESEKSQKWKSKVFIKYPALQLSEKTHNAKEREEINLKITPWDEA